MGVDLGEVIRLETEAAPEDIPEPPRSPEEPPHPSPPVPAPSTDPPTAPPPVSPETVVEEPEAPSEPSDED